MTLRWSPRTAARGTVLLLHDVLSRSETWWRVGPALASRGWRTIAPDLVGHGGMPNLTRSLDMAELVRGVVDRMPGKVDLLVGHGLGAIVALSLAGRYHDAARALVLEDPPGSNQFEAGGLLGLAGARSALVRSDRERLLADIRQSHPLWAKEDVEYAVEAVSSADVPAVLAGLRCRMEWDIRRLLGYVRVPVLVLASGDVVGRAVGDASALTVSDRKALLGRLPEQHFLVLDGGHHLHRDIPREWLGGVTEFADSVLPDTVLEEQATATLRVVDGYGLHAENEFDGVDELADDRFPDTGEGLDDTEELDATATLDVGNSLYANGTGSAGEESGSENWAEEDHVHERRMLLFDRRRSSARSTKPGAKQAKGKAAKASKAGKSGKAAKAAKAAKTAKGTKSGQAGKLVKNAAAAKKAGKTVKTTGKASPSKAAARNTAKAAKAVKPSMKQGRGR